MFFFHGDAKEQLRHLLIRSMYLQSTYFYCLRIFYFIVYIPCLLNLNMKVKIVTM